MIELPHDVKIYMAVQPVNMRKSFDGLAVIVQEVLRQNPLSSHLFVFRNKASDKLKLLWWDRNGFAIYYKRLERGRFKFPKLNKASVTLTQQELELLLDGIDITKLKRLPELHYQAVL
jgi:transposase